MTLWSGVNYPARCGASQRGCAGREVRAADMRSKVCSRSCVPLSGKGVDYCFEVVNRFEAIPV